MAHQEDPNSIKAHLFEAADVGKSVDGGEFTLNKAKAIEKIGKFQLPFEGAWCLKLLQAIVKDEAEDPIVIKLKANEIRFSFRTRTWDNSLIESAFFNSKACTHTSVDHLVQALWSLARAENRAFELSLAGSESSLVWDGEELTSQQKDHPTLNDTLTVFYPQQSLLTWVKTRVLRASQQSRILEILKNYCYLCPVPLSVDGQHLNTRFGPQLEHLYQDLPAPCFPLLSGHIENLAPTFRMPKETQSVFPSSSASHQMNGLRKMARTAIAATVHESRSQQVGAVFVFKTHWTFISNGQTCQKGQGQHRAFWILDGIVMADEELPKTPDLLCSCSLYLSAKGLDTDLSGFSLLESPERQRRIVSACRELSKLSSHELPVGKTIQAAQTHEGGYLLGGLLGVAGLSFFTMAPAVGAVTILVGYGLAKGRKNLSDARLEDIHQALLESVASLGVYGS